MIRYRAAWVLPPRRPPMEAGAVAVDRGRTVAVEAEPAGPCEDLGRVALLPGLVNAHVHLELSWMRGRVPPAESMPAWADALMALRRTVDAEPAAPMVEAIAQARASGTCLVGDITNTLAACGPLLDGAMRARVFRELLGFSAADPDALVSRAAAALERLPDGEWLRTSIVPHAPYSVSPGLLRAIARHGRGPISVHLGESAGEIEFLREGTGAWRALLERLGVWDGSWIPPRCGPVEYLDRMGLLSDRLVAVHGVQLTDAELTRLAESGATLVTCPRSNRWTGAGVPPIARFYASGVRVAIGTDSLASVEDLNLFAELAEVRRLAPSVPARRLLDSATQAGAEALGFGGEIATLTPGARAALLAIRIPAGVTDVEEYLVNGIDPDAIDWIEEPGTNLEP